MQIRFRLFLVVLGLFLLVSCSSSGSANDSDAVADADRDTQDPTTVVDEDADKDADPIDDSEVKPDEDQDNDSAECQPPLSEAPFPYSDANGKITFCRPNCDTPTADDPICIGNLWDEQNEKLCHEYPEYACCGTPCVMESLKPWTKERLAEEYPTLVEFIPMHKCDLEIGQINWGIDGSHGVVKSWNMSDGKIGFHMYPSRLSPEKWSVGRKYIIYDIATQISNKK